MIPHRCAVPHRKYSVLAKCVFRWTRGTQVKGQGRYAVVTCLHRTVWLWATEQDAEQALLLMNETSCGLQGCYRNHQLVDLGELK